MVTFPSYYLLIVFLLHTNLSAVWGKYETFLPQVEISATVDQYGTVANRPISGSVTVTHPSNLTIDESSFQMDGKPLSVTAIKTVKMASSSKIELSIYQFELPGQPAGLYVLPSISVNVGGKVYRSIRSTYEVSAIQEASSTPVEKNELSLKASIVGPSSIYPGSRLWFVYLFYYSGNIELTQETLPLLDAKGFKIIGDKSIQNYMEGHWHVQEVSQQVEALSPGTFTFPPSIIEGYAYREDSLQKRTYLAPKLQAETPEVVVTVLSLPEIGKPTSFENAIGTFTIQTHLLGPSSVIEEEPMRLAVSIKGTGELSTVSLPDLSPLKNFFRISTLPPEVEMTEEEKTFIIEIYPLSTAIKTIPSLAFSFYDSKSNQYSTVFSTPIPIEVKPLQRKPTPQPPTAQLQPTSPLGPSTVGPFEPSPIEIAGSKELTMTDLDNFWFGTRYALLLIPFGLILVMLQIAYKNYRLQQRYKIFIEESHSLLSAAMLIPNAQTDHLYRQLSKAMITRLFEANLITSPDISIDNLPKTGKAGEVRSLLLDIERARFGKESLATEEFKKKAQELFNQLESEKDIPKK